jgi:hypothetical protein
MKYNRIPNTKNIKIKGVWVSKDGNSIIIKSKEFGDRYLWFKSMSLLEEKHKSLDKTFKRFIVKLLNIKSKK